MILRWIGLDNVTKLTYRPSCLVVIREVTGGNWLVLRLLRLHIGCIQNTAETPLIKGIATPTCIYRFLLEGLSYNDMPRPLGTGDASVYRFKDSNSQLDSRTDNLDPSRRRRYGKWKYQTSSVVNRTRARNHNELIRIRLSLSLTNHHSPLESQSFFVLNWMNLIKHQVLSSSSSSSSSLNKDYLLTSLLTYLYLLIIFIFIEHSRGNSRNNYCSFFGISITSIIFLVLKLHFVPFQLCIHLL